MVERASGEKAVVVHVNRDDGLVELPTKCHFSIWRTALLAPMPHMLSFDVSYYVSKNDFEWVKMWLISWLANFKRQPSCHISFGISIVINSDGTDAFCVGVDRLAVA